jgi:SNF2 family DNA or RNA helicase
VDWLLSHGSAGIFAAPGAGKTAVTLRALLALKDAGVLKRALVIGTLRVSRKVWPHEAEEWRGSKWDRIRELKIVLLHGPKKDWALTQDADVYVINKDGLRWLFADALAAADARVQAAKAKGVHAPWKLQAKDFVRFNALDIDTLVVDESTMLKNRATKRFQMLKPLLPSIARRWILTGKPMPRSYEDLFGQIFFVDLGRALGQYVTHFRMKYFTPLDRNGWLWALRPGADKQIQDAIAPYIFQLEPGDYKEIPIIENVIRIDLPDKVRKIYDELEDDLITQIDSRVITAASAGVAAGKCAQVANGGLYHERSPEDWKRRTWTDLHEEKIEAVLELIEELQGSPCLVVYEFRHDLERLRKALGNPPWIGGDAKGVDETIDAWNRDELPVVLVNAQSMAHGLNLQYGTARNVIWHSITYDLELYDQLNRRLARQGSQHASVFSHFIVANHTVDEVKVRALHRKNKTQNAFLEALREYARNRRVT